MTFHCRYVPYGTRFVAAAGTRPAAAGRQDPTLLFENGLAVDVGSRCFGYDGCDLLIIDHHFSRPDNFPAAAAALLHQTSAIVEEVRRRGVWDSQAATDAPFWLVTHAEPDFDAYCAMFLARSILDGTCPGRDWDRHGLAQGGWTPSDSRQVNWFAPRTAGLPDDRRWPILLASYAAHVDQCRRLKVPGRRALHAVLYAAASRGRPLLADGAREVFEAARNAMTGPEPRNPLFDGLFDEASPFAPELALLDEDLARYARDVVKARKVQVTLKNEPFDEWFPAVRSVALCDPEGRVDGRHLRDSTSSCVQADGLYVRDPESLLFKEWARQDVANSPSGRGFLFTAVAYSGRTPSPVNPTEYWFSLDPERAGAAHLYNVWARLQHQEWIARGRVEPGQDRTDFVGRGVGPDPWYDGNAYRATIVVTPHQGTSQPSGRASDLGDDPVVELVRRELEDGAFSGRVVKWQDFALTDAVEQSSEGSCDLGQLPALDVPPDVLRVAWIELSRGVDAAAGRLAEQIGERLWPVLQLAGADRRPQDFADRHLLVAHDHVSVWNRRGVALAYPNGDAQRRDAIRRQVRLLASAYRDLRRLGEEQRTPEHVTPELRGKSRQLLADLVAIKQEAAKADGLVLRRLLDALGFEELLQLLDSVLSQEHEESERKRDLDLQKVFGVSAGLGVLLGGLQVFGWNPSTLMPWPVAGGLLATAAAVPIAIVLWRSKAS